MKHIGILRRRGEDYLGHIQRYVPWVPDEDGDFRPAEVLLPVAIDFENAAGEPDCAFLTVGDELVEAIMDHNGGEMFVCFDYETLELTEGAGEIKILEQVRFIHNPPEPSNN